MAHVHIIYGSTGGNTEMVCEQILEVLSENHTVTMKRGEKSESLDLTKYDFLILASPTYAHGQLEPHFIPFFNSLRGMDLAGQRCAVVGLGDNKYDNDYNVESAQILESFVAEHGGKAIVPSLLINKTPVPQLEKKVSLWASELASKI